MIVKVLRAYRTLFYHQEKSLHDHGAASQPLVMKFPNCALVTPGRSTKSTKSTNVWRHPANHRHGLRQTGILAGNRRGALPATVSVTLFVAAGWVLFMSGGGTRTSSEVSRYAFRVLVITGVVAAACFIVVFVTGRPRRIVPPSLRPGGVRSRRDFGNTPVMANHEFALRAGECEAGNFLTNHYQRNRGYGGHLFITNERLVFIPVAASRSRGALRSEFDLRQVSVAEVVARGSGPRDGGALRRRLKVSTFSGDIEYFVVWRPKKLAAIINGVAAQAR